ncbi:DUF2897 family protein [Thiopseudomonas acetoxidans]|uniref:DUF2897 family protein n=1 Tax=Thiopseudomonas acetoxidans TaxID=3041622 RepID=A0ABT7SLT4_9GAMM|nr:DUF2897 family protein [Thiopseudomonas sp. CY1220]MDM7857155.1 DUF2897 family protein [Thiopseudomonas sp. CY1220]
MPWYIWSLITAVFATVISSLLLLRDTADKMPIDPEKLERMQQRNAELAAKERAGNSDL